MYPQVTSVLCLSVSGGPLTLLVWMRVSMDSCTKFACWNWIYRLSLCLFGCCFLLFFVSFTCSYRDEVNIVYVPLIRLCFIVPKVPKSLHLVRQRNMYHKTEQNRNKHECTRFYTSTGINEEINTRPFQNWHKSGVELYSTHMAGK